MYMIYRHIYMDKILPFVDTQFVKILTGVRRCGKSTIMQMIMDELKSRGISERQILSYRFDSMEYEAISTAALLYKEIKSKLIDGKKMYLFFDEIQEVENWEKAINSLITDYDVDIYVTGSNSRMMSSEISTYLTGRYVSFRIYPLSFSEYLEFRKEYSKPGDVYSEFRRYLRMGGFPALSLREFSETDIDSVVRDIYNSTIFTDIVRRNEIRKVDLLERVVKYTFDNIGNTFSALSISKYLKSQQRKADPETVYSYLAKLESAYILHKCSRYDIRGKEILKTQEKYYLSDMSFKFSVLGYNEDMIAGALENIVYLELLRRGYDVYVGKLDASEIDFVAEKQGNRIYIQIAQKIEKEETRMREYGNLAAISDNYPKYVLRTDEFAGGNVDGIASMHIADFLLSDAF